MLLQQSMPMAWSEADVIGATMAVCGGCLGPCDPVVVDCKQGEEVLIL